MAVPKKKTSAPKKTSSTSKKSSPAVAKTPAKKIAPVVKKIVLSVEKNIPKEENIVPAKMKKINPTEADTTIFTTLLALFIVAFVVLGGYIYSRQSQRTDMLPPMDTMLPPADMERPVPRPVNVSPNVLLTPDMQEALTVLPALLFIESDDRVESAQVITDVAAVQTENWDFFKHAEAGDMIFQFKSRTVLYRPSLQQLINVGVLAPAIKPVN